MAALVGAMAQIFGTVMNWIYNIGWQNFGLAIIIFTVLSKILVFPLFLKQQFSAKAMQEIAPLQEKIKNKYKNDQQKQAEEIGKLYKEKNINPLAGCLPSIITMIVLISMFYIVKYPLTYIKKLPYEDIKHEAVVVLKDELKIKNSEEYSKVNYNEVFNKEIEISTKSKDPKFSLNMNFLGMNLGDVPSENFTKKWYLIIIPILSVITSIYFTRMSQKYISKPNVENENSTMTSVQKNMMVTMPIMSGYIAFIMPTALGLYWLIGNILQIIQYYVFEIIDKKNRNLLSKGAENND